MKITLTTAQAVALAKGIAPAISTEAIQRFHLQGIQVVTTGEYAMFTATDGFRMHRITVPQTAIESCDTFVILGAEFVAALLVTAKAIGKGSGNIVIDYDCDGTVEIIGGGLTTCVTELDTEFPPCASLLDALPETESGAYYHAPYLADIATAAAHVSGKAKKGNHDDAGMVQLVNIHPRKAMHVTAQNTITGMQFHGLLMPQRPR
jgi:hypothetical protein